MRALAFRSNGGPEVFEEVDLPAPVAGTGQVLIKVAYAGVNVAEVQHRRGDFGPVDGPGGYDVPGLEVSGTVAGLGDGVDGLSAGERVAAYLPAFGGYAEYVVTDAAFVRPTGAVPLAHAAGVPCVFPTAYGALLDAGRLRAGETVLVHAAVGGVGSAAARIARKLGAERVFGTVGSPDKRALADRFGYDALFMRDGFSRAVRDATGGRGVDLVLDPVGGPVRAASLQVLAPFGRVVVYGDLGGHADWTADVWELWKQNRSLAGFNIGDVARRSPTTIGAYLERALADLADVPAAPPEIAPLGAVAEIHRRIENRTTHGKIVLAVG